MPRSNWGFILAAFGWLILANANHPAQQHENSTSAAQPVPALPPQPSYAPYPDLNADACYQARDHDTADLCAQWRAAVAAEKSAHEADRATNWSIAATALSALALGALLFTLNQTERSLKEVRRGNLRAAREAARNTRRAVASAAETEKALAIAVRNADAAAAQVHVTEKAMKETQRIGEAQVRCYLSGVKASIGYASDRTIVTRCSIKNSGQSVARNVRCTGKLNYFQSDAKINCYGQLVSDFANFELDIPAGGEADFQPGHFKIEIDDAKAAAISTTNHLLITLEIAITAVDVFGVAVAEVDKFTTLRSFMPTVEAKWIDLRRAARINSDKPAQ